MTVIDWISLLPFWPKCILLAFILCWIFEMFLYPFKQNIQRKQIKDLLDIQQKLMAQLEKRTTDLEETNKMLAAVMGLLLRKEQTEEREKEKARNGRKKQSQNNNTVSGS